MRLFLLSSAALFMACVSVTHAADGDVVARIGTTTLSLAEAKQIAAQIPNLSQAGQQDIDHLIRTEVIRKSLAVEARQKGFDKQPEVTELMNRSADQALVASYMNSLARPPADYPPEELVKEAYEANKASLVTPAQYHLSQIYVAGTDAKAAAQADDFYRQATRKDADFAQLARKLSQHKPSADQGGDMGWVSEKNLLPTIRSSLDGLKKGEISKPVAGADGFHILKLMEQKEAQQLPLEKVKSFLVQNLRLRRAQELEAKYVDDLMAKTPVEINGIALSQLTKKD
jgi:peptidylprolyl isomerase